MTDDTRVLSDADWAGGLDEDETGPWRTESPTALWHGDTGHLNADSRRALAQLVKGPYLAAATNSKLWSALRLDEAAIRSSLHDLFLELVVDVDAGFAFVRNVVIEDVEVPKVVRSERLTFMDTAMLLVLRQLLLGGDGTARVIVGKADVYEQLAVYRTTDRDESDFTKRVNSAWTKMQRLGLLQPVRAGAAADDRVEVSPVLRMIVDPDQVKQIAAEYDRIRTVDAEDLS